MSEELQLELPAPTAKSAKTAKKAAVKKVAAKKVAAKKAAPPAKAAAKKAAAKKPAKEPKAEVLKVEIAPPPPQPPAPEPIIVEAAPAEANGTKKPKAAPRKSPTLKKAAEMLAQMQNEAAAKAAASIPAPQQISAPAIEPAPVTLPAPAPAPEPTPAPAPVIPQEPAAPAIENAAAPSAAPTQRAAPAQPAAPATGETSSDAPAPQERRKSKFERWKERRERFRQEKIARQQGGGGGQQDRQPRQNDSQERQPRQGEGQDRQSRYNNEGQDRQSRYNDGQDRQDRQSRYHDGQSAGEDDRSRGPEVVLGPPEAADGVLEMTPKGYGFLRQRDRMYAQHPNDAFISADFIRQYGLREGMQVKGIAQKGSRGLQITSVAEVNGRVPESMRDLPLFEELKAINPCKKIQLETVKDRFTTRVIDMFTPVGRGQRGLIVAPPRAGKTTMLQHIAEAVVTNHPGMHLMVLLVDERPEEVTEFKRVLPKAEIYASSNDQDVKSHTRISSFAIERAKRLVECGEHVFILMDSITRLARAFNNAKQGGATMSGGMGVGAMEIPRRLFAAARNTRTAGSLTILATALIETGSRMDDLIFQEFKGTGNMELVLDRKIAEQFYYPAVNIFKSGTRREELLLQSFQLDKIHMLRRGLAGHKPIDAIQRVLTLMERYPSNAQMLVDLPNKS